MASQVLTNASVFVDGLNMSGQLNAIGLEYGVEALDETTFGDTTRKSKGGLKTTSMSHQGYWAAGTDAEVYSSIGNSTVVTISSTAAAAGDQAYLTQTITTSYSPGAAVGELLAFSVDMESAGPLAEGTVLRNSTVTGNGDGTAYLLGALSATQTMHAALHVVSVTGGTLTVKIQSDSATGFASPTDQITFTGATVESGQYGTKAGAVTDTYWRANWTLTGGSATFIVSAGIL